MQNSRFATAFFLGHTVYMFLRLRRHGIELEEKTASKSVSKWPRESLRDCRNYIMALRACKIVASRLCFFGHTVYMFLRLRRHGIELEEKTAAKSVSKWPRYFWAPLAPWEPSAQGAEGAYKIWSAPSGPTKKITGRVSI